jgi:hypothetical protein
VTIRTSTWLQMVAGLLVIVGLPLLGAWARHTRAMQCSYDGAVIVPLYQVHIVDDRGRAREFCCIECARLWLNRDDAHARTILVTDETTGQAIAAQSAWFVRSRVITVPHTRNRIHAFQAKADAVRHADSASGAILAGADKPFAGAPLTGNLAGGKRE